MDTLGEKHIEFLQYCAEHSWKKHESDLPVSELQQMVDEGLLIKYNGIKVMYGISRAGSQVAISFGASPAREQEAIDFVISRGYDPAEAAQIVLTNGVAAILQSRAELHQSEGQREITLPLNAQGKPEIKFRG